MSHTITGWREVLENLPDSYKTWFAEERAFLQERIHPGERVLEVGCGTGRSIKDFLQWTPYVTGVDVDAVAAKAAHANFPQASIVRADANHLPFASNSFDIIACLGTPANIGSDKYNIFAEMGRVLKANGSILTTVFSEYALEERLKVYNGANIRMSKVMADGTVYFSDPRAESISEQFTEAKLNELAFASYLRIRSLDKTSNAIAYLCHMQRI